VVLLSIHSTVYLALDVSLSKGPQNSSTEMLEDVTDIIADYNAVLERVRIMVHQVKEVVCPTLETNCYYIY
jgi:hypothetical protein